MAQRHQCGWLKKEKRAHGETWVLFFRTTRKSDGKRVENKFSVGLVKDFPEKKCAWAEVERLHLPINPVNPRRGITFGDLTQHYAEHELVDHTESIHAKAHTTVRSYEPSDSQPTAAAMGKQDCAWYRAARGGGVVEGLETRKMLCKSNPRQNAPCHVHDLQAWTAIRPHFSKPGIEPHALRSLQNDQHLRSDDPNSAAGICSTA